MPGPKKIGFDTLSLHAGQHPDPATGARAVPIYQTASYVFKDTDQAAAIFNIERTGHVYSRITNPTNAVLEERIAALEGGVGAIATASGMAACHLAITTLMGAGSHIVSSASIYGGSHNLLAYTLPRFGIETSFVDARDPEAFRAAIRPETRLVFGETLGNPGLEVMNIPEIAAIAHEAGLPLMIDSFDWEGSGRFAELTEPYAGFHDMVFTEEFGPAAFITRARKEGARDFGACMSAHTAFLILQGMETLSLRMQRHVENTRKIVNFLKDHESVEWVSYPELPEHPDHALAAELYPKGCGAVFSFAVKGGRAAGQAFIERLEIFSHLANVGDARSLVIHPASTTHHRMDAEALKKAGISEGMVRVSVGLEEIDDLIGDLKAGLRSAAKVAASAARGNST